MVRGPGPYRVCRKRRNRTGRIVCWSVKTCRIPDNFRYSKYSCSFSVCGGLPLWASAERLYQQAPVRTGRGTGTGAGRGT